MGGILLLQTPGLAHAREESTRDPGPPRDVVILPHATCSAAPGRAGWVVLTADFVACPPATLRDDSVEIFIEAAFSLFPLASPPRTIRPELPLENALRRLSRLTARGEPGAHAMATRRRSSSK